MGIVYLEAMNSGCITIGTFGEGVTDIIENGVNGFLANPDDVEEISDLFKICFSMSEECREAYGCVKMIYLMMEETYQYTLTEEEMFYLTIHIQKITEKKDSMERKA